MNTKRISAGSSRNAIAMFCAILVIAAPVLAGPPLICHAINIGSAQSLAWTTNTNSLTGRSDFDVAKLIPETLALLTPGTPVLVRMETLRRAAIYAQSDTGVAKHLLLSLKSRVQENENDALGQFDFGYLAECYKQIQWARSKGMTMWGSGPGSNPAVGVDGYASVKKAIQMRGQDPEMEFAAALITVTSSQQDHDQHARKAVAGAKEDALLASNIEGNGFIAVTETARN
jgi:hypothetical protein